MVSAFDHILETPLPLPTPRQGETIDDVATRGMKVALQLLHDPVIMIKHDKEHLTMMSLKPTDDQSINIYDLAEEFHVRLDPDDNLNQGDSDTTQWHHFEIKENIPIALGMTKQITFQSALRYNDNGLESLADPGNSVTIHGLYTIMRSDKDPRSLILREVTHTRCNMMLAWYIKATMGKAHQNVHAYVRERFVERMKA